MELSGKRIGWAVTGSHCTLEKALAPGEALKKAGAELFPIISPSVSLTATRFGAPDLWRERLRRLTGREPWESISEVEPIGPQKLLDLLLVSPCTGNTLAKIANSITDTPVTMAVKAQLRNGRPVVLGLSTNDALGLNARNLGLLLSVANVFFVPFGQDNPFEKPNSLEADFTQVLETVRLALEGRQKQPLLLGRTG